MSNQLPDGTLGTAVGVLIYSLICALCSCLMIWLVWVHHERDSYVALLSYFTLVSTLASIIQQCHTIAYWKDIKLAQYHHVLANTGSPELMVAGTSVGVDLVLFYIQYYAYNVEALLSLFWACALTQTIYGYFDLEAWKRQKSITRAATKTIAVLLPVLLISLLQVHAVRRSTTAFLLLADFCLLASLVLGGILLLAVLGKYIYTKRKLLSWNVKYGRSSKTRGRNEAPRDHASIYDRWLMVRFTITFIFLSLFALFVVSFQLRQLGDTAQEALADAADLSAERARADFGSFATGVSASVLVFIMFGTTRQFLKTILRTFVPRRFQRANPMADPSTTAFPSGRGESSANDLEAEAQLGHGSTIKLQGLQMGQENSSMHSDDDWPFITSALDSNKHG
ncbi:hypothetical protein F5Y15DRAFT_365339 [Xylariaceae sp. FL0016]|nr:hypothetical protein F5Y15DRAFT_365339 [Xylariaceae sp. FL0016]